MASATDEERERRLERCDSAASRYRYGLLQRGDRWKLVAFDHAYGQAPEPPKGWDGAPEWMTLDELEACLNLRPEPDRRGDA